LISIGQIEHTKDDEHRRHVRILEGEQCKRHPGERRDRLEDLDERVERAVRERRHADKEADRNRHQRCEQEAEQHTADRIGELHADTFVVRSLVVERVLKMLDQLRTEIGRVERRLLAARRLRADEPGVFRISGQCGGFRQRGEVPRADKHGQQQRRQNQALQARRERHCARPA
jgi:hypothetical protein